MLSDTTPIQLASFRMSNQPVRPAAVRRPVKRYRLACNAGSVQLWVGNMLVSSDSQRGATAGAGEAMKSACNTSQAPSFMQLPSRSAKVVVPAFMPTSSLSQTSKTIISSTQLSGVRPLWLNPPEPSSRESSELSSSDAASLAAAASSISTSGSSALSSSLLLLLCSGEASSSGTSLGVGLRLLVVRRLLARLPAGTHRWPCRRSARWS